MLMIYSRDITCLIANLPHLLLAQTLDSPFMMVIPLLIPMGTEAWLEPCTTSPSPDLISPLQFIKYVSTCQLLPQPTLLQPKESFVTSEALFIMALSSLLVHCPSLLTLMQIGLMTQMTDGLPQDFSFTWGLMPSLGLLRSNLLSPGLPQSQSIVL